MLLDLEFVGGRNKVDKGRVGVESMISKSRKKDKESARINDELLQQGFAQTFKRRDGARRGTGRRDLVIDQ